MHKLIKILIVEDERIVAEDIHRNLQFLGYSVIGIADSANEAFKILKKAAPDIVLMDIVIHGDKDGIQTAAEIQKTYDIPIVYLTAYSDQATLDRAKLTSPHGYLLKPFEPSEIQTTIEIALYRHEMEKKLKTREEWFATTLKSIQDGVITSDTGGHISFMNKSAESLTGTSFQAAHQKTIQSVVHLVDPETGERIFIPNLFSDRKEPQLLPAKFLLIRPDGGKLSIELTISPIQSDSGKKQGYVFGLRDITIQKRAQTERESMQKQLVQAQKMEALGTLTGGVAHDFNNLLTAIQGCTDMALMRTDETSPVYHDLVEVRNASKRATDLTRQLLLFSRKHPTIFSPMNLNIVIDDLFKMLHRLIGEDIGFNTSFDENLRTVKADKGSIEQVIMNLAVNARDAMPGGGNLTIKTENVMYDEESCRQIPEARAGRFVRLSVIDTGAGITKEVLEHIFEPFFSTKGAGKGTGLGLSVVYGIVKEHGGWINVRSEVGSGTVFEILLPAIDVAPEKKKKAQIPIHTLRGDGQRILLVEDADGVREFARLALEENGYHVFATLTTKEAIRCFHDEKMQFDLLFSDVVLPDLNGLELIEKLHKENENMKILLTSGYTDHKSQWPIIQERGYAFLQKPYTLEKLLFSVKALFEGQV